MSRTSRRAPDEAEGHRVEGAARPRCGSRVRPWPSASWRARRGAAAGPGGARPRGRRRPPPACAPASGRARRCPATASDQVAACARIVARSMNSRPAEEAVAHVGHHALDARLVLGVRHPRRVDEAAVVVGELGVAAVQRAGRRGRPSRRRCPGCRAPGDAGSRRRTRRRPRGRPGTRAGVMRSTG